MKNKILMYNLFFFLINTSSAMWGMDNTSIILKNHFNDHNTIKTSDLTQINGDPHQMESHKNNIQLATIMLLGYDKDNNIGTQGWSLFDRNQEDKIDLHNRITKQMLSEFNSTNFSQNQKTTMWKSDLSENDKLFIQKNRGNWNIYNNDTQSQYHNFINTCNNIFVILAVLIKNNPNDSAKNTWDKMLLATKGKDSLIEPKLLGNLTALMNTTSSCDKQPLSKDFLPKKTIPISAFNESKKPHIIEAYENNKQLQNIVLLSMDDNQKIYQQKWSLYDRNIYEKIDMHNNIMSKALAVFHKINSPEKTARIYTTIEQWPEHQQNRITEYHKHINTYNNIFAILTTFIKKSPDITANEMWRNMLSAINQDCSSMDTTLINNLNALMNEISSDSKNQFFAELITQDNNFITFYNTTDTTNHSQKNIAKNKTANNNQWDKIKKFVTTQYENHRRKYGLIIAILITYILYRNYDNILETLPNTSTVA
jgi:hypothetical protein